MVCKVKSKNIKSKNAGKFPFDSMVIWNDIRDRKTQKGTALYRKSTTEIRVGMRDTGKAILILTGKAEDWVKRMLKPRRQVDKKS